MRTPTATSKSGGGGGRATCPTSTTRKRTHRTAAPFRGVWPAADAGRRLRGTGQTCCSTTRPLSRLAMHPHSAYLLGSDEQQTGGFAAAAILGGNGNRLVEQAYWSGTGAFVMSVENPDGGCLRQRFCLRRRGHPAGLRASPILPISVERARVVTKRPLCPSAVMGGKPAVYMQTTVRNGSHTITNEWFEVTDDISSTPKFAKAKTRRARWRASRSAGSPAWFDLFSPAAVENLGRRHGAGHEHLFKALDAAQMVDYAFDNYRQDIRLGGKKIFYDRSLCKMGGQGRQRNTPCRRMPSTARSSTNCLRRRAASTSLLHGGSTTPTCDGLQPSGGAGRWNMMMSFKEVQAGLPPL